MATNFLWGGVGSPATVLQNELNNLANGSATAYSAEQGGASQPQLATLWLHIASNSNTYTTASRMDVYIVPSTTPGSASGTYPSFTSGASYKLAASNYLAASIYIDPATFSSAVVDETYPYVLIPAGYYKIILVNQSGFAFPANNNSTLTLITTPTQY